MKKLFDFSDCYGSAPAEPGLESTSTQSEWSQFNADFEKWYHSCLAGLQPISYPPQSLPEIDKFQDTKGNIWIRSISKKGVDFKLDLLESLLKSKSILPSKTDSFIIIGIRISLKGDYSIITYGSKGIKMQKIIRKKARLVNLLKAITNNSKFPNTDLNKVSFKFWDKQR